eukprot:TRINITY_DN26931_c0_g1_i1.p1 TRINITY_DN26931_c0_g1~~TRINITY_DN26931_c0_g1_i1.p1  ORF type:complete len:436 (-),score=79.32 TRINITY_DN26931_c0_g1_i1:80-1387(-)
MLLAFSSSTLAAPSAAGPPKFDAARRVQATSCAGQTRHSNCATAAFLVTVGAVCGDRRRWRIWRYKRAATSGSSSASSRRDVLGIAASQALLSAPGSVPAAGAQVSSPLKLPNLGVGAWAWGDRLFWGYDEAQDADLRAGFDACLKGGVKLFDTAELYGPGRSEELLGKFIRESGVPDVKVATKFAAFPWKLDRSDVVKACKGSLERLGMDSIDLYQIHFPAVWKNEVFWDGLGDCFEKGLVKAVGVSNYGSDAVRAITKVLSARGIPLTSNQIQYSLIYRFPELNGMKATCDELGVKILAYSPLGLGALTGKWSSDKMPSGPRAKIAEKLLADPNWPQLVAAMRDVASAHGAGTTLSQVSIAWCIAKGTIPIPGVRNVRQAEDNLRAATLTLSPAEVQALDEAASKVQPYISPAESPFNSLRESLDTKQKMYEA